MRLCETTIIPHSGKMKNQQKMDASVGHGILVYPPDERPLGGRRPVLAVLP